MTRTELVRVRCASCGKTVAYAREGTQPLRNNVFCSDWCFEEPPVGPQEERNDEWRILAAKGRTPLSIAKLYRIAHSAVYRTLARG